MFKFLKPKLRYHILSVTRKIVSSTLSESPYTKSEAKRICHRLAKTSPNSFYRIVRKEP